MCLWAILDDHRQLLTVLDDEAPCCSPGWDPPCGGCDGCLFAQADFYGCVLIPVPVDAKRFETFQDALGNILAGAAIPGRIPALQTCLDREWQPGQILASTIWAAPRKLAFCAANPKLTIPHQAIRVVVLEPGAAKPRKEYLYALPEDVHLVETEHDSDSTMA